MKFALSTLALPPASLPLLLPHLRQMGFTGIEVMPAALPAGSRALATFRYSAEQAGLEIVGLDDILSEPFHLARLADPAEMTALVERIAGLSALCRDLGGHSLTLGSQRRIGDVPSSEAWTLCRLFLDKLLPRIEEHGTLFCFEPLGPQHADFCGPARECRLLVDYVDHPGFGLQMNSRAQVENGEPGHAPFSALRGRLDLFQASEPGFAPIGETGLVDHADMRRHLSSINHKNWVVLKQRPAADPLEGLRQSARLFSDWYLRLDNLSMLKRQAALAQGASL